jgi:hypothetical protein
VLPTKTYAVINYVNVAFQNMTAVANETWTWSVMDKSISLGPRINIFKNGALADLPSGATCDFYIKGL